MAKRTTLADVARFAGVAPTTASYVLNGQAERMRISEEAQNRVRNAAKTLSYRPNLTARTLRTTRTATIGVISDHVASGAFASPMFSGAGHTARASDHVLIIGESEGNQEVEERLIEEMLDRGVNQFLYVTLTTSVVDLPEPLRGQQVVLLNCVDEAGELPSVIPDDFAGGKLAAQLVLDAGFTEDIVVVGQDQNPRSLAGKERMRGIEETLAAAGRVITEVVPCDWDVLLAFDALNAALAGGMRPQALICLNDRIALGAYQALAEHGMSAPEVGLVSFDGSDLATWLRPTLMSVHIPYAELGARATSHLLDAHRGQVRIEMPLMRGGSIQIPETSLAGVRSV